MKLNTVSIWASVEATGGAIWGRMQLNGDSIVFDSISDVNPTGI